MYIISIIAGIVLVSIGLYGVIHNKGKQVDLKTKEKETYVSTYSTAAKNANMKTESEQKGFEFEKFVDSHFDNKYFKRLEWRSDIKGNDGLLSESSKYPDLEYEVRKSNNHYTFAVECKWRSKIVNDRVLIVSNDRQLTNYRDFANDREMDVIVILGIGGKPDSPAELYSIPLQEIETAELTTQQLKPYRLKTIPQSFYYDFHKHNIRLE